MKQHEIPGRVALAVGQGGLPKVTVTAKAATAELYLHGAHLTGFQKNGEPPLLFMSGESLFAADKAIRGGVPICFPWFGGREGDVAHGFARLAEWELAKTDATPDGTVTLHLRLPEIPARAEWKDLHAEYIVTVSDQLTLELLVTNASAQAQVFEGCLHAYFAVGDLSQVTIAGLKGLQYLDKVDNFARKLESSDAVRITSEVDRVFLNATGPVEIDDAKLRRKIRIEKTGSASTVLWNPWIAKAKAMSDFGDEEYRGMVCVEAGNVGEAKISLAPGKTSSLKMTVQSRPN
jgi:glucose-6-phosphate 1-epimerase